MRYWWAIRGPPASRARSATTAARLPPALSPATTTRSGSAPSSSAWAAAQVVAAHASSTAAGKRCSGPSRYSTDSTAQPARLASARQTRSWPSMLPMVQPPPWKYTMIGGGGDTSGRYRRTGMSPPGPGTARSSTTATGSPGGRSISPKSARACSTPSAAKPGNPISLNWRRRSSACGSTPAPFTSGRALPRLLGPVQEHPAHAPLRDVVADDDHQDDRHQEPGLIFEQAHSLHPPLSGTGGIVRVRRRSDGRGGRRGRTLRQGGRGRPPDQLVELLDLALHDGVLPAERAVELPPELVRDGDRRVRGPGREVRVLEQDPELAVQAVGVAQAAAALRVHLHQVALDLRQRLAHALGRGADLLARAGPVVGLALQLADRVDGLVHV